MGEGDGPATLGPTLPEGASDDTWVREPNAPLPPTPDLGDLPEIDPKNYRVGPEFARGGLGRILTAYDRRLNRKVALKELISTESRAEARFVREALITARLQHPNIVPIHEAGRWPSGARFYAMKLVEGRTLSRALEDAETDRERLALLPAVIDVADAVAYAHSQGILHRDLKPSNVMLGPFGETVVIDWGLAKDLRDPAPDPVADTKSVPRTSYETSDGIVVGTPAYMSPEQAGARVLDQRADVYALGAILYHVLSGRRPYQEVEASLVLQQVVQRPPRPLWELAPGLPADLVAIVAKAMARKPEDRYPSAEAMAAELRRFEAGQLVGAHRYSFWERTRRFLVQQASAVIVASAALLALTFVVVLGYRRVVEERAAAEASAAQALVQRDQTVLEKARSLIDRDPTATIAWLKELSEGVPGASSLAAEAREHGVAIQTLLRHEDAVLGVALSPDGQWVASAGADHRVILWSTKDGASRILTTHKDKVTALAFSPDGRALASASADREVRLVALVAGAEARWVGAHEGPVRALAFSPDGARLATVGEDRTVRIWFLNRSGGDTFSVASVAREAAVVFDLEGRFVWSGGHGNLLYRFDISSGGVTEFELEEEIRAFALSPDGRTLAAAGRGVWMLEVASGRVQKLAQLEAVVQALVFAPNGHRLAAGGQDGTVRLFEPSGDAVKLLGTHAERITALRFDLSSEHLLSASWDKTARLWHLETGDATVLRGHGDVVSAVAFAPGVIVTASWDKTLRIWNPGPDERWNLRGHREGVHAVDFSPDGRLLASGGHDDEVRIWDLGTQTARVLEGHEDHVYRVLFSPDGALVASSADDRTVRLWRVDTLTSKVLRGHTADVEELAFSADGAQLASAGEDNLVWLWDTTSGEGRPLVGHQHHVTAVAFHPGGGQLASASRDRTVRLWDLVGGATKVLEGHTREVMDVAYAPGGAELATAASDDTVRLWDARSGQGIRTIEGLNGARLLRYSNDERFLAVATAEDDVWLCSRAYRFCDRLVGHQSTIWDLAFLPDSRTLVTSSADGTLRLWDVETGESAALRGHRAPVFDLAVSPDGKRIASASGDADVRLWAVQLPPKPDELRRWLDTVSTSRIVEDPR